MSSSDMVGGSTHSMDFTAQQFVNQAQDFTTQLSSISTAVSNLMADWFGRGSISYQNAMVKWDKDAKQIVADLEDISGHLKGSSQKLTDLDTALANEYAGFGG